MILQVPETAKCPLDNNRFMSHEASVEAFPVNFVVRQLFEEKPAAKKVCATHQEKLRLVCLTDKCHVCDDCVFSGEHAGHEVRPLKKFEQDIVQRKKDFEDILKEFDKYEKEAQEIIEQKRDVLLNLIKDKFRDLRWLLTKKELELCFQVNSLFDQGLLDKTNEELSPSVLMKQIADLKLILDEENGFKVIGHDTSDLTANMKPGIFDDQMQNWDHKFNAVSNDFLTKLNSYTDAISDLKFSIPNMIPEDNSNANIFDALTSTKFNREFHLAMKDGWFVISMGKGVSEKNGFRDVTLDIQEWKNFKKVWLKVEKCSKPFECAQLLNAILANMSSLDSIKIECLGQERSDQVLLSLFATIFENVKSLQDLSIDLSDSKVGDQCIVPLMEEVLPKISRLKSLILNLNCTLISDNSLEALAQSMLPSLRSLEVFDLRLWDTKVTDQSVKKLFTKMEKVKKFGLDLGCTKITNESIHSLARTALPTMKALEEFKLGLTKTAVGDEGISEVFDNLISAKQVFFYLHGTNITDKSVENFAKNTLNRLQLLEVLELRLSNTKITDGSVTQLFKDLEKLKKIILKLQSTGITDKTIDAFVKRAYPSMKGLESFDIDVSDTKVSEKCLTQLFKIREKLNEQLAI
jgi:bacterioferritin-associated ferredoxin